MKPYERWFLVSIIVLYVATFAAFTVQLTNFDDHKRLDRHACELALANREILRTLVHSAAADPATPVGIRDAFVVAGHQLDHLIHETQSCAHD